MRNYYYNNFNNNYNYNFDNDTNYFNYDLNENNKEYKKRGYSLKGYNQNNQYNQNKEVRKAPKREYSSSNKYRYRLNKPIRNSNRDIVLEKLVDEERPTFLPEQIMDILRKGTARIEFEDNKNIISTSFFMKIEIKKKQYNFLITCSHSITKEDIASKKIINVYYGKVNKEKKIQIILDKSKRFIKVYKDLDVTLIELQKEDNIPDKHYLYPDLNYKNKGYSIYENIQVYTGGFPSVEIHSKTRQMSAGKIIKLLEDNEFEHNCDTRKGSSGWPIINYSGNVIGIHFGGERNKEINYGHFIGSILERLKKDGIKCLDKEIVNHFNMSNFNNFKNFAKTGVELLGPMIYDPNFKNYVKNFYQDPNNVDLLKKMPIFKDNPIPLKVIENLKDPKIFDDILEKENIDKILKKLDIEPFENRKNKKKWKNEIDFVKKLKSIISTNDLKSLIFIK